MLTAVVCKLGEITYGLGRDVDVSSWDVQIVSPCRTETVVSRLPSQNFSCIKGP